jgi:predicted metal-dependent HD superfamily phosphohydrolase
VRKEYEWGEDSMFRSLRAQILKRYLDRPAIYTTGYFRNRLEQQARENLQRSIIELTEPGFLKGDA